MRETLGPVEVRPGVDIDLAGPGRWRGGPNGIYVGVSTIDVGDPALRVTVTSEQAGQASVLLSWQQALNLQTTIAAALRALDPEHECPAH